MSAVQFLRVAGLLIVASLTLRIVAMGIMPLFDTTEARYGEMARLMWETGNWVTPLFDYGVPFWGKPPLQTWASATGIMLFGLSELTLRLPHFLAGLSIMYLCYRFARNALPHRGSIVPLLVLSCTPGFLLCIGMVMTDTLLTLGVSVSMLSVWWAVQHPSPLTQRAFAYLFFIGLAVGMLAKGPVVLVIVGLAVLPWLIIRRRLVFFVTTLPWFSGTGIMLLLCGPWYLMAEQATPGFLQYFIVGEHWSRFTVPGWQGDLYGNAHERMKGTIWLYLFYGSLPWLPWIVWRWWKEKRDLPSQNTELMLFLLSWWLAPAILFSFAGNILPAYVLPGVPAMALLVAVFWRPMYNRQMVFMAALTPLLMTCLLLLYQGGGLSQSSDKGLLTSWRKNANGIPIYYVSKRPFSGQFYSYGQAKLLPDMNSVAAQLAHEGMFVTERNSAAGPLFDDYFCQLRNQNRDRLLYYCPGH